MAEQRLQDRPADERTAPRPPEREWLYYRIQPPDLAGFDPLLAHVLRPGIAASTAAVPGLRWFYLRFVDPTGPHLRLRLSVPREHCTALAADWDARLAALPGAPAEPGDAACVRFGKFVYAPEERKFGGPAGVRLAERIFQHGSEAALACLGPRFQSMRAAYGAAQLAVLLSGLPARRRAGFLHQYAWYWSGGPQRPRGVPAGESPAALTERASRFVAHVHEVLAERETARILGDYGRACWAELRSAQRRDVPRSDSFLLFHHMHLMNNRMGVYPAVESRIARMLWAAELSGTPPRLWA